MAMDYERRRAALADALAGVLGSLVSLWAFYPIDVIKTNIQASHAPHSTENTSRSQKTLFQGLHAKTLHTVSSSFCYFYLYSWIVTWWKQNHGRNKKGMSTVTRLMLSAIAAMLNTCVTLPLDVIASHHQTKPSQDEQQSKEKQLMDRAWEQIDDEAFFDATSEEQDEKKQDDNNFHSSSTRLNEESMKLVGPTSSSTSGSLWKGLFPSLLLCSNPSIHYTVFDMLKARLTQQHGSANLSMGEAFLLGLVAKFVATMATYPLIRAKVLLMVTSQESMVQCLKDQYAKDGLRGCYRGCQLQLFHTVLKSALLMMVRERITITARRLLVSTDRSKMR